VSTQTRVRTYFLWSQIHYEQVPTAFSEGGWAGKYHANLLFSGWENVLEGGWKSLPMTWRCGKETGILQHNYFPWKDLQFYIKKGHVNIIMMEKVNILIFHKSGPANKQNANQSIIRWGLYFMLIMKITLSCELKMYLGMNLFIAMLSSWAEMENPYVKLFLWQPLHG
jgi:hypothetical protein